MNNDLCASIIWLIIVFVIMIYSLFGRSKTKRKEKYIDIDETSFLNILKHKKDNFENQKNDDKNKDQVPKLLETIKDKDKIITNQEKIIEMLEKNISGLQNNKVDVPKTS